MQMKRLLLYEEYGMIEIENQKHRRKVNMNQKILFTAVGGTDPISSTNCYDGAILHICRYYQPDKVIMYMSKEMLENQEKDNRYQYCLDKLCELQHRMMKYEVIEKKELTKVHEFDFYYEDFQKIIREMCLRGRRQ